MNLNPAIEITRISKERRLLGVMVKIVIPVLLLIGLVIITDLRMLERGKVIKSIQKYYDRYGNYPENLNILKEEMTRFKYKYGYHRCPDYFILNYGWGIFLVNSIVYYNSEDRAWNSIPWKPNYPEYKEYEKLISCINVNK